jgi:hypothetical protein
MKLQPVRASCSRTCCSRTCCSRTCCRLACSIMLQPTFCRLFEHVAAGHVAACSSMLQPDMLPPVQACCSRTCCRLFEHVAAGLVAACSSMLQPDMLPPVQACCSLIRTCCTDRIFSSLFRNWYNTSRCRSGPWEAKIT